MFKTDLEIAQECKLEHIRDVAAKIGIGEEDLEYYGNYKAKVSLDLFKGWCSRWRLCTGGAHGGYQPAFYR